MAETSEKEPQADTLNRETQLDKEPVALNRRSSRMLAIVVSVSALTAPLTSSEGAPGVTRLPRYSSDRSAGRPAKPARYMTASFHRLNPVSEQQDKAPVSHSVSANAYRSEGALLS